MVQMNRPPSTTACLSALTTRKPHGIQVPDVAIADDAIGRIIDNIMLGVPSHEVRPPTLQNPFEGLARVRLDAPATSDVPANTVKDDADPGDPRPLILGDRHGLGIELIPGDLGQVGDRGSE